MPAFWLLIVFGGLLSETAEARQTDAAIAVPPPASVAAVAADLPFAFDGPLPPIPPEIVSRDAAGRVTIRAVRLTAPLRVDGRLDEDLYASVPPISEFIQAEPREGVPATEKTEVWISFDQINVYVSFRCWESRPERIVANEMRRDGTGIYTGNDNVLFMFDTFYDRRNSIAFTMNAIGGRMDGQVVNERQYSGDWNPVWDVKGGRFEGGWTVEAVVPFKSLRYRPGRAQIWGFNARRFNRWKNEISYITRIPAARSTQGHHLASLAATVVGLEAPPGSKNLDVKPYATSALTTNGSAGPRISSEATADVGLDVKYGITQNLTSDFTYNTDFAQVEADEQQINLTRFSLFFPEKREFFLENQGLFGFGGVPATSGAGDAPILFYSRRIGLEGARSVPIRAGGRLTGRLGRFSIGGLDIQTDEDAPANPVATNFAVLRLKRDLLRRSSIGLIATRRSGGQAGRRTNQAYGIDGTFAFFDNLAINTYWARTATTGVSEDDVSYRAQLDYAGDLYGLQLERLVVGDNFNPEVGFVRRDDMRRSFGLLRFSPRPRGIKSIRKVSWVGAMGYLENGAGRLETREWDGEFAIEFQNSDRFSAGYGSTYEFLPRPFRIASDVVVPIGGYEFATGRVAFSFGRQRKLAGNLSAEHGTFYDGHRTAIAFGQGRLNLGPRLSIEPTYSLNRVTLIEGAFTTHLLGSRVTFTMTPLMFAGALLQYNSSSHTVTANVRLRWEYRPGSELFIVFNEQRDTHTRRFPSLENRTLILKINRLLRF